MLRVEAADPSLVARAMNLASARAALKRGLPFTLLSGRLKFPATIGDDLTIPVLIGPHQNTPGVAEIAGSGCHDRARVGVDFLLF